MLKSALLILILCALDVRAQSPSNYTELLWTVLEAGNQQLQEDIAAQMEGLADCADCAEIRSSLSRLKTWWEQFEQDQQRAFETLLSGRAEDSLLLLSRIKLQELQQGLGDFMARVQSADRAGNSALSLPAFDPGLYPDDQVQSWYWQQKCIAALGLRQGLEDLQKKLSAVMPEAVFIAPAALNVLYTGLDNPLRVYGGRAEPSSIQLQGPGIGRDSLSGEWTTRPSDPGPVEIVLSGTASDGSAVKGRATFEARRLPEPQIWIAGRSDGVIVKKEIGVQTGIAARNDDFLFAAGYSIRGFEMVYTPEYGSPAIARTPGNKFTEEMLAILKRTKPGDRILFRVAVGFPDNTTKTISPVFYVR